MIPTNSSGTTNGCDNISSNCVIWQGPDISCIDLCSGDTISEVTSKLAIQVCDLITNGVTSNPSLTGLDLTCLNIAGQTPTTLVPVLQAMVTQICLNNTNSAITKETVLPVMTLPACLQYNDASGNPVTELRLDLFATLIANQVCTNLASITTINSTLTSYSSRLDILEACVLPCSGAVTQVQIVPTCVSNVGTLTNVSVVVLALETAFCALRTAVGLPSAISTAISQSVITGSYSSLTTSSVSYGSITGWNNSASTLAQSMQNAWVVIDDMYTAIASIQTNCCPSGCDSVTFAYTTSNSLNSSGIIDGVLFNFLGSSIPSGYLDTSGFTNLTLTDALGATLTTTVSVAALQSSSSGYTFSTGALNTQQDLSVAVGFSVTNGVDTCTADQSSVITGIVPCTTPVVSAITATGATVTVSNLLGTTAVYVIDILTAAGVVAATFTQNSPGPTFNNAFTGLVAGTTYTVRLTVTLGGATQVCTSTAQTFDTTTADAPCTNGMDVAFIIDYTGSMGGAIANIQAGVASLVSTIDTSSGANNYRISLATADEYASAGTPLPTYENSTDYIALPAAQKIINTGISDKQVITAWEMFQDNNGASFTTQLNLLDSGAAPGGVPLGNGSGDPEPTDMALGQIIEASAFTGAFRASVAKYVIIITDNLPSGDDDVFNNIDIARLASLEQTALLNGIKIFVLGAGTSGTYTAGGVTTYPWRDLATNTNGAWNLSEDASQISSEIVTGCS
jgi:hypothetical protein